MSITFEKNNDTGLLRPDGEMTIYTAAEMKPDLLGPLAECDEIEMDLSAVTEIDSAGLQLLMVMKSEARRLEHEVRFTNHSQPVIELFELLKLSGRFADPIVFPSEWQRS